MNNRTSFAAPLVAIFVITVGAVAAPAGAETPASALADETGQDFLSAAVGTASEYWTSAVGVIDGWIPDISSGDLLTRHFDPEIGSETSELDFTNMMSAAGYSVKSFKMGIGVLPKFSFSFGQKREISSFDYDHIQRLLRKHKRSRSGPKAIAERMIIQTVLDIQRFPKYDLAKVDVTMLPIPYVEFTAEPKSLTLDSETSYLVRRIDELNSSLERISAQ